MWIKVLIEKKAKEWEEHGETNDLNRWIDSITFQVKPILPCHWLTANSSRNLYGQRWMSND